MGGLLFFRLHRDANLDIDSLGNRCQADQVTDPIYEMNAAQEVHVPVFTIHQSPDSGWKLVSHEIEFFAEGLEEASSAFTQCPRSMGVESVCPQRETGVKFVLSYFDQVVCHVEFPLPLVVIINDDEPLAADEGLI